LELEFGGRTVLRRTIDRLLQSDEIEHVCLVAPENWDHRAALEGLEPSSHLHIVYAPEPVFGAGHADIRAARAWSDSCSRGGIANLCVFDEVFSAKAALLACEHVHANAVLVCGADWPLVAVDESWGVRGLMERWRASARDLKFVCSLAAPGIGACFLPIESVRLLASDAAGSIGQWIEERADDRNAAEIIDIPDFVAAVPERLVMDTPRCIQRIRRALEPLLHGAEISADVQFEALARHRGSLLGATPDSPQPSQRAFETSLWFQLARCQPGRLVWLESESRKIGQIQIPESIIERMRSSPHYQLEVESKVRSKYLLDHYQHWIREPERLQAITLKLRPFLSSEAYAALEQSLSQQRLEEFVGLLLKHHYDPLYDRSIAKNFRSEKRRIALTALDGASLQDAVRQIREQHRDSAQVPEVGSFTAAA
ncbi:MAG: hypothetical protein EBW88_09680, partial [Betaproteobacteria bacterium]|nr:hypothetical protein [Betaproteobacteria bacterium]